MSIIIKTKGDNMDLDKISNEYLKYLKDGYSQRYIGKDDPWFTNFDLEDQYIDNECKDSTE